MPNKYKERMYDHTGTGVRESAWCLTKQVNVVMEKYAAHAACENIVKNGTSCILSTSTTKSGQVQAERVASISCLTCT